MLGFKKKKTMVIPSLYESPLPPPSKDDKRFQTMKNIIEDAERYNRNHEKKISINLLESLIDYVEKYIENNREDKSC